MAKIRDPKILKLYVTNVLFSYALIWIVVVYFDQLLSAGRTQKLVELLLSAIFNLFCSLKTFFNDFTAEINKKRLKMNKKVIFVYCK